MATGSPDSPKALIGASIPRSGHHFLQNLLSAYYGERLRYCEYYSPPNCCKTFPCTRRGAHSITYQKSHDRKQEVPKDLADAFYIVQYRHPVAEALSDRELDLHDGLGRRSLDYRRSRDYYVSWLALKAIYYRKFHDKWMTNRVSNGVYVDYGALSKDPRPALSAIVGWASGSVDEPLIERVIDQASAKRVSTPATGPAAKTFKPRVVEESPSFDADLLGAFEAYVLERCPNFGFARQLSGSFEKHPLYGLILLEDADEPLPAGATNRFKTAASYAPDHPEIALRLAQKDVNDEKIDEAIASLQALVRRQPYFAAAYKLLFSVSKKAGRPVPASLLDGNSLFGCSKSPDLLVDIGATFLAEEHVVSAITALSLAITTEPDHARANHLMALALANDKKWKQAEPYAAKAHALEPDNDATAKLLNRIQKHTA